MSLDERVSDLIKRIYCAGEDIGAWDSVANSLLSLTGGCAGLTTLVDLKNGQFSSYRFYGPEESATAQGMAEYAETYVDDPSLAWACKNPAARYCDSSKTVASDDYVSHPFVKWNLARFGSTHWYVGYTEPEDDLSFSFSVHFPATQGPGSTRALGLFHMLFDHMECAVRLNRRPFDPESERALVLLDAGGCIRQLSTGAQTLFRTSGALSIAAKRLVSTCPTEQTLLENAINKALNTVATGNRPQAIKLHTVHGKPWIVVIKPKLSSYGPFGQIRCDLLVEIHEGLPRIGSIELLRSLFDLTSREMELIRLLADGHSVESSAHCMEITQNTAKTHLHAIFTKTATTRQSELLQLCAGLSAL